MDLTGTQIKNTYGNVLTIGTTAGSPTTGTLQNGAGDNITEFSFGSFGSIVGTGGYSLRIYGGGQSWLPNLGIVSNLGFGPAFTSDTFLTRDGASNTLAQRNSTNAQTFNLYNTYTDASNYERGFLKWNSNVLKIGTEALGTGTARNIQVFVGATQLLTIGGSAVELLKPLRANANYIEFTEMTAPSAPSTNLVRIYAEDNGSGKTKLMALFPTGVAQQIAIEP